MSDAIVHLQIDRRRTLHWLTASVAAAAASACNDVTGNQAAWPTLDLPSLTAKGYGTDPNMTQPSVPWPLTFTPAQLDKIKVIVDVILPRDQVYPSASEAGVHDFINEWISAPYKKQSEDRQIILEGLEWIDRRAKSLTKASFLKSTPRQRSALIEQLAATLPSDENKATAFFARVRYLTLGAYFSTEAGIKSINYIGNVPITGDWPGPTPEALTHLTSVLTSLDLPFQKG